MEDIFDLCVVYFWKIIYGVPYMIFKGIPNVMEYYVHVDWIRPVLDVTAFDIITHFPVLFFFGYVIYRL